jgi:SAM-dependent methyltransferase
MSVCAPDNASIVEMRARLSQGSSSRAIYEMVAAALEQRNAAGDLFLDVGCGMGNLWRYVRTRFRRYIGLDVVRYDGFPADGEFAPINLDSGGLGFADAVADVVVAVETIEHLENPRAFMRELVRLAKPSGWVVVTTPNQLSILSKLTLLVKNQFNAFQEGSYPAHLTALLEVDLMRIACECGLVDLEVRHSCLGRLAATSRHYPRALSRLFPRACSDNVLLIGRKPRA